jgi:2'-hydroxyisoflavone reductase
MEADVHLTRREFVRAVLGASAAGLGASGLACAAPGARAGSASAGVGGTSRQGLRVLVFGGTRFLGPEVVRAALARGHRVTLFNRGRTNPGLFPGVETLHGDRDGGLDALRGRDFECVVDTSGYVPRIVRQSAELLAPRIERYLFVSSISVYAEPLAPGATESAPLATLADPASEDVAASYGALKAACERAVEAVLPARALLVRPGLIVGPGDPTDRFTYWPVRVARGGEVLAPGDGEDPVQLVDVRDLGAFLVTLLEHRATGAIHATGPAQPLPMRALLAACREAAPGDARLAWVDAPFLARHGVRPWVDLPAWVPRRESALAQLDVGNAVRHGLAFRPVVETARDTLAWWRTLPADRRAAPGAGLSPERERQVLAAWRGR